MILQDLDHRSIDVAQQLADRSLDNIADPSSLYDRVLERRSHIDVGIKTPWSKLDGLFSKCGGRASQPAIKKVDERVDYLFW